MASPRHGRSPAELAFFAYLPRPAGALATIAALLFSATVAAAPSADDLDQRIRMLERQLELLKEDADKQAASASVASVGDKGLSVKKGDFALALRGLVQLDARAFSDDFNPDNRSITASTDTNSLYARDTILFRRVRPTLTGSFGPLVGFRLTPEFAGDSASLIDAYIDLKFDPAATLRAGKVKGPVGLERLQSGAALMFVERGLPTELAPNRDLGVQLQGELLGATLNYTVGIYNGAADGRNAAASDSDNRQELAARLFAEPFRNTSGVLQGLGFGIAGSSGSKIGNGNNYTPRYRTPGQITFFQYIASSAAVVGDDADGDGIPDVTPAVTGVVADGRHTRLSPQFYWYYSRVGLLGEYIRSEQELARGSEQRELAHSAWQIAGSYVLTGEEASYRGLKPNQPFTIGGPGWGALELALRYGELEVDKDAFAGDSSSWFARPDRSAQQATAYSVGLNWYLTANVKTVLNYTRTAFEGGAAPISDGVASDRNDEKAYFARLQLSF